MKNDRISKGASEVPQFQRSMKTFRSHYHKWIRHPICTVLKNWASISSTKIDIPLPLSLQTNSWPGKKLYIYQRNHGWPCTYVISYVIIYLIQSLGHQFHSEWCSTTSTKPTCEWKCEMRYKKKKKRTKCNKELSLNDHARSLHYFGSITTLTWALDKLPLCRWAICNNITIINKNTNINIMMLHFKRIIAAIDVH